MREIVYETVVEKLPFYTFTPCRAPFGRGDENRRGGRGEEVSHNNRLCDINRYILGGLRRSGPDYRGDFVSHNVGRSGGYVKNGAQKPILAETASCS